MDIPSGPDLSTVEKWLRYVATGEGEPCEILLSDVEKYLAYIATGEGQELLPEPDTRIEEWLAYIAEHGGGGGTSFLTLATAQKLNPPIATADVIVTPTIVSSASATIVE